MKLPTFCDLNEEIPCFYSILAFYEMVRMTETGGGANQYLLQIIFLCGL